MYAAYFIMLLKSILIFYLCTRLSYGDGNYTTNVYDSVSGGLLSTEELNSYKAKDLIENCTQNFKPCDASEGRRVDGSCNNLKHTARGVYFQPLRRILPAHYDKDVFARKAKSGKELTLVRKVRTKVLKAGKGYHKLFNQNVPSFAAFMFTDFGSVHDIEENVLEYPYCCEKEHMNDYRCTPTIIPEDDPVHRFSGIRCMNSTRPLTYQDYGCTEDSIPSPLAKATPTFDLSQIYNQQNKGEKAVRSYSCGQLRTEEEYGKAWPPNGPTAVCPLNQEDETRCFENHINGLLPLTLYNVLFLKFHNYIAANLAAVNPCWDDDKLFTVARDINIAFNMQILLYEWLSILQGREYLIKAGVISDHEGFRDIYDDNLYPTMSLEYTFANRWFHLLQESIAKKYTPDGVFIEEYPALNLTFRPGYPCKENHYEQLLQGTFRAPCHGGPHTVDYDMAERGLPIVQLSMDIPANDLNKCRNFGLAPYIDYVQYFTGKNITTFEELPEYITEEYIDLLKEVYADVEDIDLLAGMWVGKNIKGGHIPYMLGWIMNEDILRAIKSDRHHYEYKCRPNSFTPPELMEIRQASLAQLFCAVGDGVTKIPRHAFLNISPENPLVDCSEIPHIDYSAWADEKCLCNNAVSESCATNYFNQTTTKQDVFKSGSKNNVC